MPFKKVNHSDISAESPEALFRDLRNRQVQGLLSHQADLLREYCKREFIDSADVALQLPTGSGKTLIGLLIADAVVRNLRRIFPNEADLKWRKEATQKYMDNALDPASLIHMLRNQLLSDLPKN